MAGRVEARVRPGGAGRPPKAPLGQERAKCPYRPQFWLRRPIRIRWEEVGHDWCTYITLLAGVLLQTGTLGLDVAYAAARVALSTETGKRQGFERLKRSFTCLAATERGLGQLADSWPVCRQL